MTTSPLDSFLARLPKVELHLHLEGSLRPQTLRELARRKNRNLKEIDYWISDREREGYRYGNFKGFLDAFTLVVLLLEKPEDYRLATLDLGEWLAAQNVRYAEVTHSAGVLLWKREPLEPFAEALFAASAEAEQRWGVRLRWIFDAVRQFGVAHARQVLRESARFRERGVVAFGIGGDESQGQAGDFAEVFREARDLGFHTTAHAGETAGPESIRAAVELLGAERIGHGTSAARDAGVMALLRERGIALEVCPTSNVSTGVVVRLEDHPLPVFLENGLTATLNSDDPALFGTSLEEEFRRAAKAFALTREQVVALCQNAIRAAFLAEEDKVKLLRELRDAVL
jgi:adenosine deaminase/aminodeoxyfutalosine deaminase